MLAIEPDWDHDLDVDVVLRAQGADPDILRQRNSDAVDIAIDAVRVGRELLRPHLTSTLVKVRDFRHQQLRLEPEGHFSGPLVAEHLFAASYVVVAVVSVGSGIEELASERFSDDPAMGLALDAFGSAAVELLTQTLCQQVDEMATRKGLQTSLPLSPGLIGWPVKLGQRQIFSQLNSAGLLVSLNEGSMMYPHKSTSFVIGVGADVRKEGTPCDFCSMSATCNFQHEHLVPHG